MPFGELGPGLGAELPSVLAVAMPRVPGRVDMAHSTIQATSADLPMPWPDATASRIASSGDFALPELLQDSRCRPGPLSSARSVPAAPVKALRT
jgi:hypothetical protein